MFIAFCVQYFHTDLDSGHCTLLLLLSIYVRVFSIVVHVYPAASASVLILADLYMNMEPAHQPRPQDSRRKRSPNDDSTDEGIEDDETNSGHTFSRGKPSLERPTKRTKLDLVTTTSAQSSSRRTTGRFISVAVPPLPCSSSSSNRARRTPTPEDTIRVRCPALKRARRTPTPEDTIRVHCPSPKRVKRTPIPEDTIRGRPPPSKTVNRPFTPDKTTPVVSKSPDLLLHMVSATNFEDTNCKQSPTPLDLSSDNVQGYDFDKDGFQMTNASLQEWYRHQDRQRSMQASSFLNPDDDLLCSQTITQSTTTGDPDQSTMATEEQTGTAEAQGGWPEYDDKDESNGWSGDAAEQSISVPSSQWPSTDVRTQKAIEYCRILDIGLIALASTAINEERMSSTTFHSEHSEYAEHLLTNVMLPILASTNQAVLRQIIYGNLALAYRKNADIKGELQRINGRRNHPGIYMQLLVDEYGFSPSSNELTEVITLMRRYCKRDKSNEDTQEARKINTSFNSNSEQSVSIVCYIDIHRIA